MKINNNTIAGRIVAYALANHNVAAIEYLDTANLPTSRVRISIKHGDDGVFEVDYSYHGELLHVLFVDPSKVRAVHLLRLSDLLRAAEEAARNV
jgi:hypothetical protein